METVIGLNLNHHDTCIFTNSIGDEGLSELDQFIHQTLLDAEHLVALRLRDRRLPRPLTGLGSRGLSTAGC